MIDAGWPHEAAVTAETCRGDGYLTTHFFCTELSLCPRHWYYRREDRDYVVFCFADPAHAALFRKRFGGVEVNRKMR
jgi:hypothetical protein